ncbi:hypothetical protein GCM10011321_02200 [Youhaiella tibetensis]|uniref:Uncharacterized protein n=1 Tax=Paradevosia tibetensis TaxID=1447062 RepID=A0A5B9DQS8_9HYPH|nr:peptidase inhibitor family I36 protein [Youhaiella tibetensis]QEE21567.1 hypothetical protein FNA67_15830 [Youhaiella tibetensis]GGF13800.1 hypothetical protein GCM10011321_02200 [Youhaiella tibetensis]
MHRPDSLSLTTLVSALLGIILALFSTQAALAGKAHLYGSNAWTNNAGALLSGPGSPYHQVGSVEGEIRVLVDRCTGRWCQIRAGRQAGWFPLDSLNFGLRPGSPWSGPRLNYPSGGPGMVCFYSGANFSGASFCSPPGTYVRDLALLNRDNQVRSVEVIGNTSAIICRDFKMTNGCTRIIESKGRLPEGFGGAVSSYRVY